MSTTFLIKHKVGGRFVHPRDGHIPNPPNFCPLITRSAIHDRMHFEFDPVEDGWGYIRHVTSGKIIHPKGGTTNPANHVCLLLHEERNGTALFAIDETNDLIIHKDGKYIHPTTGYTIPNDGTALVLCENRHEGMRFVCVSPTDANRKVSVYGDPNVKGSWQIVNAVLKPQAEHAYKLHVKVGKSSTLSKSSDFKFRWEIYPAADFVTVTAKTSHAKQKLLNQMVLKASSNTWEEEREQTRQITG